MFEPLDTILIAEDNPVNQRVVKHMISKMGYKVEVVNHGADAVEHAGLKSYACILMDMMMPVMDGLTASELIREHEASHPYANRTPIVALTANAYPSDERKCLEAGMDAFISKPFTFGQLKSSIESILGPKNQEKDQSLLDSAVLNTFVRTMGEDDLEFIKELFSDFMTEANRVRSEISHGLELGEATPILRAVHSLKGSAAVLGATGLVTISKEIELLAKRNSMSDIALRMSHFEGAINTVGSELNTYFQALIQPTS